MSDEMLQYKNTLMLHNGCQQLPAVLQKNCTFQLKADSALTFKLANNQLFTSVCQSKQPHFHQRRLNSADEPELRHSSNSGSLITINISSTCSMTRLVYKAVE
jgi:hypothetical protein